MEIFQNGIRPTALHVIKLIYKNVGPSEFYSRVVRKMPDVSEEHACRVLFVSLLG